MASLASVGGNNQSCIPIHDSRFTIHDSRVTGLSSFTLIELLAVVGIIVLLAGIIIGTASFANRKALHSRAQGQMHELTLALELYKNDFGTFPVTPYMWPKEKAISHTYYGSAPYVWAVSLNPNNAMYISNSLALYQCLTTYTGLNGPPSAPPRKNYYQELRAEQVQAVSIKETNLNITTTFNLIVDPYGNPWGYFNGSDAASRTNQYNPRTYDLWSYGLDGAEPTNSLIGNWRQQ